MDASANPVICVQRKPPRREYYSPSLFRVAAAFLADALRSLAVRFFAVSIASLGLNLGLLELLWRSHSVGSLEAQAIAVAVATPFNFLGNKFFRVAFSWLLSQSVKDSLCGTKVLSRSHYETIAANRAYFGEIDPFGDFDLLFGAARYNLKILDLPVRYRERKYGETNIQRWRHGVLLLRMVMLASRRIRFV